VRGPRGVWPWEAMPGAGAPKKNAKGRNRKAGPGFALMKDAGRQREIQSRAIAVQKQHLRRAPRRGRAGTWDGRQFEFANFRTVHERRSSGLIWDSDLGFCSGILTWGLNLRNRSDLDNTLDNTLNNTLNNALNNTNDNTEEKHMKRTTQKQIVLALALGAVLPIAAAQAQYNRVAPPPPVVERHMPAPGRGYVWVEGYQRWDGGRYVWVGGRWVLPPRRTAIWISGHWAATPRGWHWIPGHWRG
jgi:hypothetical protein